MRFNSRLTRWTVQLVQCVGIT